MKLKDLREHPLLNPPGVEQTPWLEITPHNVHVMVQELYETSDDVFPMNAAAVKALRLDVAEEVMMYVPEMMKTLRNDVKEKEWGNFAEHAAAVKNLGVDVTKAVKKHEPEMRRHLQYARVDDDFSRIAAAMTTLGLDVAEDVKRQEPELREQLRDYENGEWWDCFTSLAADMKTLGLDVSEDVKRHAPEIRRYLHYTDWKLLLIDYAASMLQLGLLTPNPAYRKTETPLPPLKRIGR